MTEAGPYAWCGDELSEAEFQAITAVLHTKRQFDVGAYKDKCVRRRIAKRLRNCGAADFRAYLMRLEEDPEEVDALLEAISIHVSHFFRDPGTFRCLERDVLPDLVAQAQEAGRHGLRFWSVGCATGEEVYSLALLMEEIDPGELTIEILGADISSPALENARRGRYDAIRLKEVPSAVLKKYFRQDGGLYQIDDRLRHAVRFERHDLLATEACCPQSDLILCRNVLIYFSRAEQERILRQFATSLSPFGRLVLGRSEIMDGSSARLFTAEFPLERVYRRSVGGDRPGEMIDHAKSMFPGDTNAR
ncbi:MAG: protein-glutamate O-methyltransferase CheR [Deltaproteobacteria bacterium]|jgi:chemotaxis protein methyltransferase CheR|nr:protein-glutamate O-methyltransferase CheR [Deltaproteobacteria bacterium]MBW2503072.1 protein-glutamate O-methyltransferase CheR [Deltaproteobacteria bacterium]